MFQTKVNYDLGWPFLWLYIPVVFYPDCYHMYHTFLKEGNRIKEVLFKEFSNGCFFEELIEKETLETYRKQYTTKESLFEETEIVEVRIHRSGYSVIILLFRLFLVWSKKSDSN